MPLRSHRYLGNIRDAHFILAQHPCISSKPTRRTRTRNRYKQTLEYRYHCRLGYSDCVTTWGVRGRHGAIISMIISHQLFTCEFLKVFLVWNVRPSTSSSVRSIRGIFITSLDRRSFDCVIWRDGNIRLISGRRLGMARSVSVFRDGQRTRGQPAS